MSFRFRLLLAIVSLVVGSVVVSGTVSLFWSATLLEDAIERQVKNDLDAKRVQIASRVQAYISTIEKQIVDLAQDPFIAKATNDLKAGFYAEQLTSQSQILQSYYQDVFKENFDSRNSQPIDVDPILAQLSKRASHFQSSFIANSQYPTGEKHRLIMRADQTSYDQAHKTYHPRINYFLQSFGYYDIFLVDPDSGDVFYSVFKEVDFATNLRTGPFRQSNLAEAYRQALQLNDKQTYLTDFAEYTPSYNAPSSFITTPIYQNGELLAILVFQMPIDVLNSIMTLDRAWSKKGFGTSAEIYLVGQDSRLRSESRFFLEDKEGYLATLAERGVAEVKEIAAKNTTISIQRVNTTASSSALNGETGFMLVQDYRGVDVFSSFSPVSLGNLNWSIMAEMDKAEAYASVLQLENELLSASVITGIVLVVIAIAIAYWLSGRLIGPIRLIASRLSNMSQGDADLTYRLRPVGIAELDSISDGLNAFVVRLQKMIARITSAIDTLAAASTELSASTEQTSQTTKLQREKTQEVYSAIASVLALVEDNQAVTASAVENTSRSKESTQVNSERAAMAEQNIQQLVAEVDSSAETLKNLHEEVTRINEVLSVIDSIADQTNLLALNAAIEAARAGEHGRGFAVVADEVRTLASKTQESTVIIQEQITQLTRAAESSVESMSRASVSAQGGIHLVSTVSKTLQDLQNNIMSLADVNHSVAESGDRQVSEMARIRNHIESLNTSSQELEETTQSITDAAINLSFVAEQLMKDTKDFKA
ncbi:MAG: methyl-accepting chemotaxis protein [Kangiellaceae bacterium]|jgi:methyl-accepting chemotaxis protein|nr:methyl-accepting chemotaxis protein [Kangiellaceae bacterium]